jgi:antitoxin component HigA of HigAB toxin-antitoxin module
LWNKSTVISIIVGLLIAEKMKQSAPNNNRTLLIPLIKKLKERYNISDDFIEKFITQKFTKLKGFNIDTSKLDYLINPKSVTNEALFSVEEINKIVDKVASVHTNGKIEQQKSETSNELKKFPHMVYVEKAWSILGQFARFNVANFDTKLDMIERKIFQFKALRQQEGKNTSASKKMDTIQNYMFVMILISLLDDYKLTVADFKNKIVSENVTESVLLEGKTESEKFLTLMLNLLKNTGIKLSMSYSEILKKAVEIGKSENPSMETISNIINDDIKKNKSVNESLVSLKEYEEKSVMGYMATNNNETRQSLAVYDKIEPQYIEWLLQWQGQVLQNDFIRWKQFFEFSFKNAMKKVAEQDRMFIELMKIIFDTLKLGN